VTATWMPGGAGVLALPSGRLVRGRGLRGADPDGPDPEFALYVVASEPFGVPWKFRWIAWPDYGLPADPAALRCALVEASERADRERVEVGCMGGRGRTGTALACIAVLDGVPANQAVDYVRRHYLPDAVETDEQRQFVAAFAPLGQQRAHSLARPMDEPLEVVSFSQGRLKNDRIGAGLRQPGDGRGRTAGVMVGDVQVDGEAVAVDAPGDGLPLGDELAGTADFLRAVARDKDGPVGGLPAQPQRARSDRPDEHLGRHGRRPLQRHVVKAHVPAIG